ncbi:hypothetical protein [Mucilaginibacter sp.]
MAGTEDKQALVEHKADIVSFEYAVQFLILLAVGLLVFSFL